MIPFLALVWAEVAEKREKREWQLERESDDLFPRVFRRMAAVSGEMEVSRALLGRRGAFWG